MQEIKEEEELERHSVSIATSVELLAVRLKDAVKEGRLDDLKVNPALRQLVITRWGPCSGAR